MQDHHSCVSTGPRGTPWNKGKLIGAKPPLRPKHVWSIRTRLLIGGRTRDLAMFNLAIDSNRFRSRALALFFQGRSLRALHNYARGVPPRPHESSKGRRPNGLIGPPRGPPRADRAFGNVSCARTRS